MVTEITEGVRVTVETEYQPEYSDPSQSHYVFTYQVTIENNSNFTVKLLRRHWKVIDVGYPQRDVEGEGVIGKQPTLEPEQQHQYVSGCNLKSGIGKMKGTFLMERITDGKQFRAIIPEFTLIAPYRVN